MDEMRNLPIEDFYNEFDMIYKDKPLNKWGYATAIKRINDTPIHFDDYIALMLVLKGGCDIKVSFNDYRLKAGDFLLINAYGIHRMVPIYEQM